MKVHVWPANGRVVFIDSNGVLRRVAPAVGTVLPPFCLQVLSGKALADGVVDPKVHYGELQGAP